MSVESIEQQLQELTRQLEALPEAEEPPPTTLQVLGNSQSERAWQRLLVHFLQAGQAHGFEHAVVEHLLRALSKREDVTYSYSRLDLETLQVEQEVVTDQGRPDIVMWSPENWFICWELKVAASEGEDQTQRYVDVSSFKGIGINKTDISENDHHYIYLAPADAPSPDAPEFIHVSWEWVATELQAFLTDSFGKYPVRATAQLDDLITTIRSELTMTEYQENRNEKLNLYMEYADQIHELQSIFDEEWDQLADEWGDRLANTLDIGEIESSSPVPDEYVSFLLEKDNQPERWVFRQGHSDWAVLFKDGWWRQVETGDHTYDRNRPDSRILFTHRLEQHREDAVLDHELKFYFRNTPPSPDGFFETFASYFVDEEKNEQIRSVAPERMELTGKPRMLMQGTYPIDVAGHETFFEAYISAVKDAFVDNVVEHEEFIRTIDDIYEESFENIDR